MLLQNSKLQDFQALVISDWKFPKGRLKALLFGGGEKSAVFRPVELSSAGGEHRSQQGSVPSLLPHRESGSS